MKIKNKKGIVFGFALVILTLILIVAVYTLSSLKTAKFKYDLGDQQFNLLKTHQRAEQELFYLDQTVKYSAYKTLSQLSEELESQDCGTYLGYPLWTKEDQDMFIECYPDNSKLEEEFKQLFDKNLEEYLKDKPGQVNYNYQFEDKQTRFKLTGFALKSNLMDIDEK